MSSILHWLATAHLIGIGPVRIKRWLKKFGNLRELFSTHSAELKLAGLTEKEIYELKKVNWYQLEQEFNWSQKENCHLITIEDPHYPKLLLETPDAPLLLYLFGDKELLNQPQLALVGTRNPTVIGEELAEQFAYCLSKAGLIITSGLALGIDAASHRGALSACGKTIAVCGTGLKCIYPPSNKALASEIKEKGALVSEFSPDTPPKAKHFPMRNRLISGVCLGVLVVEAALRSGSLITARYANEQGREVFAVPGSIHNPLSRGCHYLIQQGAKLVETAEDILLELGSIKAITSSPKISLKMDNLDTKQKLILEQIGYEITYLDAIILRSGLTAAEVSSMLLALELEGYVKMVPGGYIRNPS